MTSHIAANPVSALETGVTILEAIRECEGATLVELDEKLDFSKSTIHRHLSTFRQEGYVLQENGEFHISLHLFDLASYNRGRNPLFHIGRSTVDEVARQIEERVSLVVAEQGRAVKCYIAESDRSVTTDAHLGLSMHLYCTSGGKALLAHMSEEEIGAVLDEEIRPLTNNTITDRETLLTELQNIRTEGVAFDDQERLAGVRGVAAPVIDKHSDEVIGAIDIAGPATRLEGDRFTKEIPDLVRRASDEIALNIQYWRR